MKRFLLIQTAFIGDVILATPLVAELRRIYPEAEIDVLVRKGNESLLKYDPAIREILTFDKKNKKLAELRRLLRSIRTRKYDEVINLQRFASSGLLTGLSNAKSKVGFRKNPFSFLYTLKLEHDIHSGKHEVERNLSCIAHHGAVSMRRPSLFPSKDDFACVEKFQEQTYSCLAPASIWFTKQLPEAKWVELAQHLVKNEIVYLNGGPGDIALCDRIVRQVDHPHCINISGQLSLLQSAALFQKARMNYVNDSGPLHLCSGMNAPVTAFFCSTTPAFGFGPLSTNSTLIESTEMLTCKPCGLHGYKSCPKGHFKCGIGIVVPQI